MKCYLAIDIGASSGRHIVGWQEDGAVQTKEVYRFPNGVTEENGHLTWDIRKLFSHVVMGIAEWQITIEAGEIVTASDEYEKRCLGSPASSMGGCVYSLRFKSIWGAAGWIPDCAYYFFDTVPERSLSKNREH